MFCHAFSKLLLLANQTHVGGTPQALTCHLLHESAKGSASFWAPYIAVLPRREEYDLLASWSDTEIEQLQAGIQH